MIRLLVPHPLSQALDAADARLRALTAILGTLPMGEGSRVCIVGPHWAALSRDALEATVNAAVERWERGEIGADMAAREVFRALSSGGDESTQPG
jgi:hypothetical protein